MFIYSPAVDYYLCKSMLSPVLSLVGALQILAKALESSRCPSSDRAALRVLVCGRNRLENEGATALAETFEKLGTLEEVSLYQNGINASGISDLAKSFGANTSLRYLDLNDNTFTVEGAVAMAEVLPKLSVLEYINFDDCLVRNGGFEAFAGVMESHCARIRVSSSRVLSFWSIAYRESMTQQVC